jgi:tripartite-type tricarboxylate transporter receptor subunit TctC
MMTLLNAVHRILAATLLIAAPLVHAQDTYPNKQIRFIVPWAAGNLTDIVARKFGEKLSKALGQQIWIDNKPGAGGAIGMETLSKSVPDGYTIGLSAIGPMALSPALFSKLPYEPVRGFVPISMVFKGPAFVLLVESTSSISNLQELLLAAQSRSAGLNYASAGNGTLQHMTAELFKRYSGANLVHVPYRGSSEAIASVLGKQVPVLFETVSVVHPLIQSGRLRALAIGSAQRSPLLPNVPTFAETGHREVVTEGWQCVLAPAGTPIEIRQRIGTEIREIASAPEMAVWANALGGMAVSSTPDELAIYVRSEIARWAEVIRTAGIKLE